MKNIFNKILMALLVVMAVSPAFAVTFAADTPRFTYTNIEEPQPDLYVSKSVSSAVDGYSVPTDAEFTFVLKWDQDGDGYLEFAENAAYSLYDTNGNQIYNDETNSYIFRTSSTGRFTLKDGQYARFEWAGTVAYEITELEEDNYIQITPSAGEAAEGVVDSKGTMVEFENLYIPVSTDSEETMVVVRKDVDWPNGYELPELEDKFTFEISVDGDLYTNEAFDIYDSSVTNVIGNGRTDSDGQFSIAGNQAAVFEEVEAGVDYSVKEIAQDGWKTISQNTYKGSTQSPVVYTYFTNAGAAFGVSKERADGIVTDEEFTFVLTDKDGNVMEDIPYYLYDENKNLVSSGVTDNNGEFTLRPGQSVIFTGINDGTEYKVSEKSTEGFDANTESNEGTVNLESFTDNEFVNTQLSSVSIRKVQNNLSSKLLGGAEFTIYKLKEGGDVNNMEDYEEIETLTTETDEDDEDFGTLTFAGLSAGTYRIKETKAPENYTAYGDDIIVTLPYEMTEEEARRVDVNSEEFTGMYSERDGVYYLYDLTYEVSNNMALMVLPNTGSNTWAYVFMLAIAALLVAVIVYRRREGGKYA